MNSQSHNTTVRDIRKVFIETLASMSDDYRDGMLGLWRRLAKAEASIRTSYQGRALFELVQNAHDALTSEGDGQIRIEVQRDALLVANTGMPFGDKEVRALCDLFASSKRPGATIGHKGIGFKSVLELSVTPEIYSTTYAFRFDGERLRAEVAQIVGVTRVPDYLPALQVPFDCDSRPNAVSRLFADGYVTVIRLPFRGDTAYDELLIQMREHLTPATLLFLPRVSLFEIGIDAISEHYTLLKESRRIWEVPPVTRVEVVYGHDNATTSHGTWCKVGPVPVPFSLELLLGIDEALAEPWRGVEQVHISVAFPLPVDGTLPLSSTSKFHVYFPTDEDTGVPFLIHGDFFVSDNRKTIPVTSPLNKKLVNTLLEQLPDLIEIHLSLVDLDASLVPLLLLPAETRPSQGIGQYFIQEYEKILPRIPFVPIDGGGYRCPRDVRFAPRGVDAATFIARFPAPKDESWGYGHAALSEEIQKRLKPFGAKVVTPIEVAQQIRSLEPPSLEDAHGWIAFVAAWFASLDKSDQTAILPTLRLSPILPTGDGWHRPSSIEVKVFQARLDGRELPVVPQGFAYTLIRRDVYPVIGASDSAPWLLFKALGVSDFNTRDIVRDAILPTLKRHQLVSTLTPEAVSHAYIQLWKYYQGDGRQDGRPDTLDQVYVPVFWNGESLGWERAGDCYFGAVWGEEGALLERLYASFEDCCFLAPLSPAWESRLSDGQAAWYQFFHWLGVKSTPRIRLLDADSLPLRKQFTQQVVYNHILHCNRGVMKQPKAQWWCLDHFGDITTLASPEDLAALYGLLARHWDTYDVSTYRTMSVHCGHSKCYSSTIQSYLVFELNHSAWIPAGQLGRDRWSPVDLWYIDKTAPRDVRALVPTVPEVLEVSDDLRRLTRFLGYKQAGNATLQEFIDLYAVLSERFPEPDRRVETVHAWILEQWQAYFQDNKGLPPRPTTVKVLVDTVAGLTYTSLRDPYLFYPDDKFLADRWDSSLKLLKMPRDTEKVRQWLGIRDLSEAVETQPAIGEPLSVLTTELSSKWERLMPYLLAYIRQQQRTRYESKHELIRRLRWQGAEAIELHETLASLPDVAPLTQSVSVFLDHKDSAAPILYITPSGAVQPEAFATDIAHYLSIQYLADVIVILWDRDDLGRRNYLRSRGVSLTDIEALLVETESVPSPFFPATGEDTHRGGTTVTRDLLHKSASVPASPSTPSPRQGTTLNDAANTRSGDEETNGNEPYSDPSVPFDTTREVAITHYQSPEVLPGVTPISSLASGGGGGGASSSLSRTTLERRGTRGEEWVFTIAEPQRLRVAGLDPDHLKAEGLLRWIAQDGHATNYDILSVRATTPDDLTPIYIEVKSSVASEVLVHLTFAEWKLARQEDMRDVYRLYCVTNVLDAIPSLTIVDQVAARLWQGTLPFTFEKLMFRIKSPTA